LRVNKVVGAFFFPPCTLVAVARPDLLIRLNLLDLELTFKSMAGKWLRRNLGFFKTSREVQTGPLSAYLTSGPAM